jgi:hypothetical protein
MRRLASAIVLLALATGVPACRKTSDPPPIAWHDLEEGEALARKQHRLALVFVTAEWSTADKELDYRTFPDPEVREIASGFVPIRIDVSDDELENVQHVKDRFDVKGVPTILVVDFEDYPLRYRYPPDRYDLYRANEFVTPDKLAPQLRAVRKEWTSRMLSSAGTPRRSGKP